MERGNRIGARGDTGFVYRSSFLVKGSTSALEGWAVLYTATPQKGLTRFSDESRHEGLIHLSTIDPLRGGNRRLYTTSGAQLHKQLGGSREGNKLPQEQSSQIVTKRSRYCKEYLDRRILQVNGEELMRLIRDADGCDLLLQFPQRTRASGG